MPENRERGTTMETYAHMRDRHQKEISALPIHFAFGRTQLDEKLKELGVKCPADELVSVGMGGFCLKKDAQNIARTFVRHRAEMRMAMQDEAFFVGAVKYEASNHEYYYAGDPDYDMAMCFGWPYSRRDGGIQWDKMPDGKRLSGWYAKGIGEYLDWCNEHL